MSDLSLLQNLSTIRSTDHPTVGGKAAALGELLYAGFRVPAGFVIPVGVAPTDDELLSAFDALGAPQVAVRSSATVEDGARSAWAGQFETYLQVTREQLIDRVRACRDSAHSPRAQAYAELASTQPNEVGVAIIVQHMVAAEVAGVAFSVHPVTADAQQIVIECVPGLGDALVSGQATPDTYTVEKNTSAPLDAIIAPGRIDAQLSLLQLQQLTTTVRDIEQLFGFPVDVEWAYAKGTFYILQARPITTL